MYRSPLSLALMLIALAPDLPRRDENLVYDDERPIWCETNDCDIETCHRCFPRKGCIDHKKCQEQGV